MRIRQRQRLPADIDGSGHINVNDLLVFLPQYGNFCSEPDHDWNEKATPTGGLF